MTDSNELEFNTSTEQSKYISKIWFPEEINIIDLIKNEVNEYKVTDDGLNIFFKWEGEPTCIHSSWGENKLKGTVKIKAYTKRSEKEDQLTDEFVKFLHSLMGVSYEDIEETNSRIVFSSCGERYEINKLDTLFIGDEPYTYGGYNERGMPCFSTEEKYVSMEEVENKNFDFSIISSSEGMALKVTHAKYKDIPVRLE